MYELLWHGVCVLVSFPATLPTMDGGPLLVNDFLANSDRIFVGEGPESIEPLNGTVRSRTLFAS